MATGVLPVFCGGASKAVDLQLNHDKSYRAVLKLGARTDTGDVTGTVLELSLIHISYEAGARDVQVNWSDDAVARARMELGSEEALTDLKPWQMCIRDSRTSASRMLLVGTAQIAAKATRDSQGVAVVTLKKNQTCLLYTSRQSKLSAPPRKRLKWCPT